MMHGFTRKVHEVDMASEAQAWVILGSGGHARSLCSTIRRRGDAVVGIAGPNEGDEAFWNTFENLKFFERDSDAAAFAALYGHSVCIAVGANDVRSRLAEWLMDIMPLHCLPPLIAATATADPTAALSPLTQVLEHAHVGPQASVGSATIINTSAVVEHDAIIGMACHLAPGALLLGGANVGNKVFLGAGSCVLPRITVASNATIGAGAAVTQHVRRAGVYVGVPATEKLSRKGSSV